MSSAKKVLEKIGNQIYSKWKLQKGWKIRTLNQQGFALTLAAVLLAFGLLSLAISLTDSRHAQQGVQETWLGMHQVQFKHENISDNLTEILQIVGNVNWKIENNIVMFRERLPDKQRKGQSQLDLESYKKFALRYSDGLDINLDVETVETDTWNIQPVDVNYGHAQTSGKKRKQPNQAVFTPKEINFSGYLLDITLLNQSYGSVIMDIKTCSGSCTQPIYVDLNIRNSNRVIENSLRNNNVDINKTSTITIKTSGESNNDVVITLGPNGKLTTINNNSKPIELSQGIDVGNGIQPLMNWSAKLIEVSNPRLGQRKQ